jgi:hypothetical protein
MTELITTEPTEQKQKLGRRFFEATACAYPPAVMPDDVLLVDMDIDRVTVDGLYLVERIDGRTVTWMGCRRFELSVLGGINMVEASGELVAFAADVGLRIAGRVLRVYGRKS